MGTEEGMGKAPASSVGSDDVLQVHSKWSYLPINPTYDQYVQRWVVMPEREGFHVKTRSAMKQLLEDAKWMIRQKKEPSFLSGKRKMGLALARDPEPATSSTSSSLSEFCCS